MRIRRAEVVVDAAALVCALDHHDPAHTSVLSELVALLERMRSGEVILVSHSAAATAANVELRGRGYGPSAYDRVHAVVSALDAETLHRDLLDDAEAVRRAAADLGVELTPLHAITVEIARRRGTTTVLSTDAVYTALGLTLLPAAGGEAARPADRLANYSNPA